ncbi:MAG: DivIVA domain-containing protein [Bdellovibrionales bacterium]|jgi:cell division initiation protein
MKIAPIDIAHKSFTRRMMGLDQDEVTNFLRLVAEEMEGLIRDRNNLRESIREKELAILEFRERDELLKSTITTATRMSDKIQQDAERESRLILNDAKQQSEMIVRDARDSLKKMFQEISDLKRIRMQYENNLRVLVNSHLTMLEQGQKVMPDPDILNSQMREVREAKDLETLKSTVTDTVRRSIQNLDSQLS